MKRDSKWTTFGNVMFKLRVEGNILTSAKILKNKSYANRESDSENTCVRTQ